MPAAAVIPAPIAYIKVVAVKKLVVGTRGVGPTWSAGTVCTGRPAPPPGPSRRPPLTERPAGSGTFTLRKLECSKQAQRALNTAAWNNGIGSRALFRWFRQRATMVNRNSWGYSYFIARGEILGFMKDELVRKHLSRMLSLIKNES